MIAAAAGLPAVVGLSERDSALVKSLTGHDGAAPLGQLVIAAEYLKVAVLVRLDL